MNFTRRADAGEEEVESYFVSMTDMMVGVIFIFIIMLSFFALQYRSSTAELSSAKDAQTNLLLEVATKLEAQNARVEIDREHHVLCVPSNILTDAQDGRRCFPYSGEPTELLKKPTSSVERASLVQFLATDLLGAPVQADAQNGNITYPADQLFDPGTANLSSAGRDSAAKLAASLATRLPCYAYGAPQPSDCGPSKMAVVNIAASAQFDAYSEEGRAAAALALRRSVSFHDALVADQPILGRLTNAPPEQPGAQPLLRVASYGQSQKAAPAGGAGQAISIQFQMVTER